MEKKDFVSTIFKEVSGILVGGKTPTLVSAHDEQGERVISPNEIRRELAARDDLQYWALCIRVQDTHNRRKYYEVWVRGYTWRRVLEMMIPNRKACGMSHDKYSIIMAYLVRWGIVARASKGYIWAGEYQSMRVRHEWLMSHLHEKGKFGVPAKQGRWLILD